MHYIIFALDFPSINLISISSSFFKSVTDLTILPFNSIKEYPLVSVFSGLNASYLAIFLIIRFFLSLYILIILF